MNRTEPAVYPSISRKLTQMNLLVCVVALSFACVTFVAYDAVTLRQGVRDNLSTQAQMVAANSSAALAFGDPTSAEMTLAALRAAPQIIAARIFTPDRQPFAAYWRDGSGQDLPLPDGTADEEAFAVNLEGVTVTRPITLDGKVLGYVEIQSDLEVVYDRLLRYAVLVGAVLLSSMLAAFAVSRWARRGMSKPLVELARVAQRVTDEKDYSLRAATGADTSQELAVLAQTFNEMLAQIQQRDQELEASHNELDERVRQRTAELAALNQELEAFTYSVSHDLRSPLRHVTGFASLLKAHAGAGLDDKSQHYLTTMIDAANRMGRLIDDLLAFSRMGRASLSPREIDLRTLVRDAQAEVAGESKAREIIWEIHDLPTVTADPALLRPVLVNLLSNAVKYSGTREVARIEVGTLPAANSNGNGGGEVVVYVRDNGVGFDMAYVNKLFGVFQRLHRSDEFAGTGIGLANVRRIIGRHGGRTWAEGEVGKGATFYFTLPR